MTWTDMLLSMMRDEEGRLSRLAEEARAGGKPDGAKLLEAVLAVLAVAEMLEADGVVPRHDQMDRIRQKDMIIRDLGAGT